MTFQQAIDKVKNNQLSQAAVLRLIENLQSEYAPTIELPKPVAQLLHEFQDSGFDFSDFWQTFTQNADIIPAGFDETILDQASPWADAYSTQHEELQIAWIHPETIEIVN